MEDLLDMEAKRQRRHEVTHGRSSGSMTSVDNSSNAGVEARLRSSSISGKMEAQGSSSSLSLSSSSEWKYGSAGQQQQHQRQCGCAGQPQQGHYYFCGNSSSAGVEARAISSSSSSCSCSRSSGHMPLWSGTLMRLAVNRVWYQPGPPSPAGASMPGFYFCARCGAREHRDVICRAPNSVCGYYIFHGRMARQCGTVQPTAVYVSNY